MSKLVWDAERIAGLSLTDVRNLRANAHRLGNEAVASLCDAEIALRAPKKTISPGAKPMSLRKGRHVVGFHFVCDNEKGVSLNSDGTFWSGTWVVDQLHAARGVELNAYVALHRKKTELSYRQGTIRGWRKVDRERQYGEQPVKRDVGIDFLLEPTNKPYQWVGSGAGEKGYAWSGA